MTATLDDRVAELERANAELQRQLGECTAVLEEERQQQAATAEVLQVINSSSGDLAPVFQAILQKAHALCGAAFGGLMTYDGERLHAVATHNVPLAFAKVVGRPFRPGPKNRLGDLIRGAPLVHVADLRDVAASAPDDNVVRTAVELGGIRTILFVALRKDDVLLGQIVAARQEVRPFTEKEITLVENFAAQAVIAMENARLLTETREALEQQTATAEVLQVINSSPGDLTPVFDAMLEKAMRLCEAAFGILLVRDGDEFRTAALHGVPPAMADFLSRTPRQPGKHTAVGRMLDGEDIVQFEDMAKETAYLTGDSRQRAFVELGGTRTYIAVALRKDGKLVGTIGAYRQEVRLFSDKQIALLQNFAAQAVIAMENARLITEMREALEQQTATAEVLQVINSSPGELGPVFDVMLDKAMRLCGAPLGLLLEFDGECFRTATLHGAPPPYVEFMLRGPIRPGPNTGLARLAATRRLVHIEDLAAEAAYREGDPLRKASVDLAGMRTFLAVPAHQRKRPVGRIRHLPPRSPAVLRQADRAVAELRRAGGHRNGERAAHHRNT
jgi:GAF domain-containing protein